jgi:RimJ/RimL family protein N-acetyltransferase
MLWAGGGRSNWVIDMRAYWNRGYATEAGLTMLNRGFTELALERIVAIVDVLNPASERVMQKPGMTMVASGTRDGIALRGYGIDPSTFVLRDKNAAVPDGG